MPEEIKTDTNEEVLETTQGEEQPEALSTSEEPTEEVVEEESSVQDEDELPEGVKERTREQFEKLKKHNEELKKQLEERKNIPSVLDFLGSPAPSVQPETREQYMQPPVVAPTVQVPQPQEEPLVDEQGYVNADVLTKQLASIEEARKRAEEAERRSFEAQQRILKYEQDQEQARLYEAYPELDPLSDSFNQDAYDLVKNELNSQIVNTGKRDAIKAAERMSKFFRQAQPQATPQAIQQRIQATSTPGNQPRQTTSVDMDDLRVRTMKGDPNATAERLKRLGL